MTARFRLYYNSDGTVNQYSMEDLPGDWIAVDVATFHAHRHDVRVIKGKIVPLHSVTLTYHLVDTPTDTTIATDPYDILLLVDSDQQHILWDYRSDN